jgi:hypothetical protein
VRGETIASEQVRQNAENQFNNAGREVVFLEQGSPRALEMAGEQVNASYAWPTEFLPEPGAVEIAEETEHLRQDLAVDAGGEKLGPVEVEIDAKLQAIYNAEEYGLSPNDQEFLRQLAIKDFVQAGGLDLVGGSGSGRVFEPLNLDGLMQPFNPDTNYRPIAYNVDSFR